MILATFDSYHWIYWAGPVLGAVVAVLFYRIIKFLEYETANPGVDSDGAERQYADAPGASNDPQRKPLAPKATR